LIGRQRLRQHSRIESVQTRTGDRASPALARAAV
jgi:hypothetical protein